MRSRVLLSAGLFLLGHALLGCSSGEAVTAEEDRSAASDDNTDTGTTESDQTDSTTKTESDSTDPAKEPGSSSKIEPANTPPGEKPPGEKPPGTEEPKPTPPPPANMKCANNEGVYEVEGNDDAAKGTALDESYVFCGSFASENDVDHFTFVLPADATDFGWEAQSSAGTYKFVISSEGVTADKDGDLAPWFPGKPYVIKLTSTAKADYTFRLKIKRGP